MRKQARRLWFGDWQSDQEPTRSRAAGSDPGADTVVFIPDDEDAPRPSDRKRNLQRGAILTAIAVFIAAVFALLSDGDKRLTSNRVEAPQTQAPQVQPQVPQPPIPQGPQGAPPQGFGGPDLTGAAAEKAARAALAKFPGDIERVTRDSTGAGYVVHVIEADGNEVHVLVDGQFHVRGSDAGSGPGTPVPGRSQ
jgi:hypothetical protein